MPVSQERERLEQERRRQQEQEKQLEKQRELERQREEERRKEIERREARRRKTRNIHLIKYKCKQCLQFDKPDAVVYVCVSRLLSVNWSVSASWNGSASVGRSF